MEKSKLIKTLDDALKVVKPVEGTLTIESAAANVSGTISHSTPEADVQAVNEAFEVIKAAEQNLTVEGASYEQRLDDIAKNFSSIKIEKNESLAVESGSGSAIAPGLRASLLINVGRSNQDAFTEEFFPSILTGEQTQITVKYTLGSYIKDWKEGSKELLPIHETIIDTSFLQGNTLRLIPAYDVNSKYLNTSRKITVQNGSKSVETAPYKFGEDIDIIASVVDEVNLYGQTNNIRTIAPTLRLDTVFFTNAESGVKNAAGDDIEYDSVDEVKFQFSPLNLADSTAMKAPNGKDEDFFIKFGPKRTFELPLSAITDGTGASKFASYPDSKLVFKLEVNGDGNLTTSITKVSAPSFKVIGVKNASGVVESSGAVYDAVMNVIKDVTPAAGYTLEVFEANGDVVNEGNLLTLDNNSRVEPIGYKQPLTIKGPIANLFSKDTDIANLAQFITHSGDKCSVDGKTELLRAFEAVKNSEGGTKNIKGIGNELIKPVCVTDALDINAIFRSMENTNVEGSLKAALLSSIKLVATKMITTSAYKATFNRFYPNRKMRLSVGIDQRLQAWLPEGTYNISPDFDLVVVATFDKRFDDKIKLAFTSSASDRNKDFDILGLGCCAYDTTVVTQVRKTIGGSTTEAVMAFPKYEHLIFCTVLGEIEVSGIDQLFLG